MKAACFDGCSTRVKAHARQAGIVAAHTASPLKDYASGVLLLLFVSTFLGALFGALLTVRDDVSVALGLAPGDGLLIFLFFAGLAFTGFLLAWATSRTPRAHLKDPTLRGRRARADAPSAPANPSAPAAPPTPAPPAHKATDFTVVDRKAFKSEGAHPGRPLR